MTTATEMQGWVNKTVTNMDRIHRFVNGGPTETVTLDGGVVVPSIQKQVLIHGAVDEARDEAQRAAAEAAVMSRPVTLPEAIRMVEQGQAQRIAAPGQWKVWREGEAVRHETIKEPPPPPAPTPPPPRMMLTGPG